jgi:hypothetical protein
MYDVRHMPIMCTTISNNISETATIIMVIHIKNNNLCRYDMAYFIHDNTLNIHELNTCFDYSYYNISFRKNNISQIIAKQSLKVYKSKLRIVYNRDIDFDTYSFIN